jgi:hypothetical protein
MGSIGINSISRIFRVTGLQPEWDTNTRKLEGKEREMTEWNSDERS